MKSIPKIAICMLIATLLLTAIPTDAEADIYRDTIRLHILANSDSDEDQTLKLTIRDKVLEKYGEMLRSAGSFEDAEKKATELLPYIEFDAENWIQQMGYNYNVSVSLSQEWYETRDYEDFSLPCGIYSSLRIIIGDGKGKNWWCVMYPPLCTEFATENAPADDGLIDYSREELMLIQNGKYNVKFKILEDLSRVFAKNS